MHLQTVKAYFPTLPSNCSHCFFVCLFVFLNCSAVFSLHFCVPAILSKSSVYINSCTQTVNKHTLGIKTAVANIICFNWNTIVHVYVWTLHSFAAFSLPLAYENFPVNPNGVLTVHTEWLLDVMLYSVHTGEKGFQETISRNWDGLKNQTLCIATYNVRAHWEGLQTLKGPHKAFIFMIFTFIGCIFIFIFHFPTLSGLNESTLG